MSKPSDLKSTGLRVTTPRLRILELFETTEERHLSAEDVHRILINEQMDVGLATVYRTLIQFVDAGLIERHHFDSGKAVFEKSTGIHHDHLVCIECGRVEEFSDETIERRQRTIAKEHGFALFDHSLCLYGKCSNRDCGNRKEEA